MDKITERAMWLRSLRQDHDWSAAQLAERIRDMARRLGEDMSVTQQAISHFEQRKTKSLPKWLRLAELAFEFSGISRENRDEWLREQNLYSRGAEGSLRPTTVEERSLVGRYRRLPEPLQDFLVAFADEPGALITMAGVVNAANERDTPLSEIFGNRDLPDKAHFDGENPSKPTLETIAEQLGLVPIAEIDLAYGLGATFTDNPIELQTRWFPETFIETISASPATALTLARGRGDSMEPTIRDNELVIIDRSERSVRYDDLIWALTIGEIGMIKRLRVRGRKVHLMSDNKEVSNDEADADEVNIVGRVIFVGRRL